MPKPLDRIWERAERAWKAAPESATGGRRSGLRPVGAFSCLTLEEAVAQLPCRDSLAKQLLKESGAISSLDGRPVVWGQDLMRVTQSAQATARQVDAKQAVKRPRKKRRSIAELTGKAAG